MQNKRRKLKQTKCITIGAYECDVVWYKTTDNRTDVTSWEASQKNFVFYWNINLSKPFYIFPFLFSIADGSYLSVRDTGLSFQLWPALTASHTFGELHAILTDLAEMNTSRLTLESNPGRWWLERMPESGEDERVKLMTSLPVLLQDGVPDASRERYTWVLRVKYWLTLNSWEA